MLAGKIMIALFLCALIFALFLSVAMVETPKGKSFGRRRRERRRAPRTLEMIADRREEGVLRAG